MFFAFFLFQKKYTFLSFIVLVAVSISKYYTYFNLLLSLKNRKVIRILVGCCILVVACEILYSTSLSGSISIPSTDGTFEAVVLIGEIGYFHFFIILTLAMLVTYLLQFKLPGIVDINLQDLKVSNHHFKWWLFTTFLFCYVGGSNYDYRLIILQFMILFSINKSEIFRTNIFYFTSLFIISYTSFNVEENFQIIGDAFQLFLIVWFLPMYFLFLKEVFKTGKETFH
jgi:hypothetical protein